MLCAQAERDGICVSKPRGGICASESQKGGGVSMRERREGAGFVRERKRREGGGLCKFGKRFTKNLGVNRFPFFCTKFSSQRR